MTATSSEILVHFYQTTQYSNPHDKCWLSERWLVYFSHYQCNINLNDNAYLCQWFLRMHIIPSTQPCYIGTTFHQLAHVLSNKYSYYDSHRMSLCVYNPHATWECSLSTCPCYATSDTLYLWKPLRMCRVSLMLTWIEQTAANTSTNNTQRGKQY
jgi:hypothetical protein